MSEWTTAPIESLLASSFPGEWGAEPNGGPTEAVVYRGADFEASGRLGPDAGVRRNIPAGKLRKLSLKGGDILLEKSGGSPEQPVGRVSLFEGLPEAAVSSNFLQTLRPRGEIDSEFLFYLLQYEYRSGRVLPFQQQTTGLINFRLKDYLKEEVSLPADRREQRQIAEVLSTLDEQIAQTEALVKKETARTTGLMQRFFPAGFNVGSLPVRRLSSALQRIEGGKSFMCSDEPAPEGKWGVLKVSAVRPEGFVSAENKRVENLTLVNPRYEVRQGDLLITRANTPELVGAACLVDSLQARLLLCDKTLRLVPNGDATPEYLSMWLQTPVVRRHIEAHATGTSAGMKNISQSSLGHIPLSLPAKAEQAVGTALVAAQRTHVRQLRLEAEKFKKLKAGLSHALLTGIARAPIKGGFFA